ACAQDGRDSLTRFERLLSPELPEPAANGQGSRPSQPTKLVPPQDLNGRAPIIQWGTGVFIDESMASGRGPPSPTDGNVTLNFVDTEIAEVLRAVLGDMLKLNYVLDPRIKGQITLKTNRPIRRADVLP